MKSDTISGDSLVQEMIRTAMQRLSSNNQRNQPITKQQILKILFKTKELLPDDNPVKSHLAYYWYVDGPYSEVIYSNIDKLVSMGIVNRYKTSEYETYKLTPARTLIPLVPFNDYVDRAREMVSQVIKTFSNIDTAIDEIYAKAPFRWYVTYRREFQPKFESYGNAILNSRKSMYTKDDISNCLDNAVLEYPTPPEFIEHQRIFMDFSKMLNSFLYSSKSSAHICNEMLRTLLPLADRIWKVFAEGVRITQHDDYYNDKVEKWKNVYKSNINTLDSDIILYTKKFESVGDDRRFTPEIENMVLHPEKYDFKPYVINAESSINS